MLVGIGIGLNLVSFGLNLSSALRNFARGQNAEGHQDMAWAMLDLLTLSLPFAGPGTQVVRAGAGVIEMVSGLSRAGVNAAAIWGYLTALFSVASTASGGGNGAGSSGSGSSGGAWGEPPERTMSEAHAAYERRIVEQFGDPRPTPTSEFSFGGNSPWFDGVKQSTKKLLEAKGPGYEKLFSKLVDEYGITAPLDKIQKQLLQQSVVAGRHGYTVEVHVAEKAAADRIRSVAPGNVTVIHTP